MKYYDDVKQFHDKFGMVTPPSFLHFPVDLYEFRVKFFHEELDEYVESHATQDLPTAIDSLIDLVYITCGTALLHGLPSSIFDPETIGAELPAVVNLELFKKPPTLLAIESHQELVTNITEAINLYRVGYTRISELAISTALSNIFYHSLYGALQMGFDQKRWDMMWDDVQRANMSKERAVRADQSKRGSTYDVIKPIGWVAPRSEEMIELMLQGAA